MVSLRMLAGAAAAVAVLMVPATAGGATQPTVTSPDCTEAVAAVVTAQRDYNAIRKDYEQLINQGGHPDMSQREQLQSAETERDATASQASGSARRAPAPAAVEVERLGRSRPAAA